MSDNLKSRQNNLALVLVFVGASMGLTSKYKHEIEPYRIAAHETIASALSLGSNNAEAAPVNLAVK